jgi:hypothetical protein
LLTSQAGIFVDWGADRGSVVLTVVVVWISDRSDPVGDWGARDPKTGGV